jgi:hypothetical protein
MSKFNCIICNYATNEKSNLNRHLKSNKHLTKVIDTSNTKNKIINQNTSSTPTHTNAHQITSKMSNVIRNNLTCKNCDICFSRISSLVRHQKNCTYNNEVVLLKNKLEQAEKENKFIAEENAYHKQMLNEAGGLVKKSVSTLSYVMHNYGSAPTIEMLDVDDLEDLEQNNKKLVEDVISAHKHKTLDKYLGDSITTLYKKENPKDQSVWSTDTSRLTYLIKELMVNNSSNWVIDKRGAKTKEYLIDPLLKHIKVLVIDYQETMSIGKTMCEMEYHAETNKQIIKLIVDIDDEVVGNNLLKYISSHLFFNDKLLK